MVRSISLLAATVFTAFARAQTNSGTNQDSQAHIFDIYPPIVCDESCKQQPEYYLPCGDGMACFWGGSKCGNWAGYKNYCCVQDLPQKTSNISCDDVATYLGSFDLTKDGTAGIQVHADSSADIKCPSGTLWFTGTDSDKGTAGAGFTGTCCDINGDAVAFVPMNNSLLMPSVVRCIPRQGQTDDTSGGSSTTAGSTPLPTSDGNTPSSSPKPNTAGKIEIVSRFTFGIAILLVVRLAL
ncbi:hypothetical protein ABW20_dc0106733 [Dactylellina cionopaga]|nr:hypothetical protein ABW20_dc0106733 [Dactylellina cionopaga]